MNDIFARLNSISKEGINFGKNFTDELNFLKEREKLYVINKLFSEISSAYIHCLLFPEKKSKILVLGDIYGGIVTNLALYNTNIIGFDRNIEKLKILYQYVKKNNIENIQLIKGSFQNFPFKKKYFDSVIIIHPSFNKYFLDNSAQVVLADLIKESSIYLKNKGKMVILAENLLSYKKINIFQRKKNMPESASPRNGWVNCLNACSSNTVSIKNCIKTLRDVQLRFHSSIGIDLDDNELIPFGLKGQIAPFRRSKKKLSIKSIIKKNLLKTFNFTPYYGVVASKSSNCISSIEKVLEDVFILMRLNKVITIDEPVICSIENRKTNRIFIKVITKNKSNAEILIKIPYGKWANKYEEKNFSTLKTIHNLVDLPQKFKRVVPFPVIQKQYEGRNIYIESLLPGKQLRKPNEVIKSQALDFIISLHDATKTEIFIDKATYLELTKRNYDILLNVCKSLEHKEIVNKIMAYIENQLVGTKMLFVLTHGDFSYANFLVKQTKELSGIVDWETSLTIGFPAIDLFFLLFNSKEMIEKMDDNSFDKILREPKKIFDSNLILKNYFVKFKLENDQLPLFFLIHWLTQIVNRAESFNKRFDHIWLQKYILNVLSKIDGALF